MRGLGVILLIALLLPIVLADVDAEFRVEGNLIEYVSIGEYITGELYFTPHKDASEVMVSSLNIEGGGKRVITTSCVRCSTTLRILAHEEIPFTFLQDTGVEIIEDSSTLIFRSDNVPPVIEDIAVGDCTTTCTYGPESQELTFSVIDTQSGVDQNSIIINDVFAVCEADVGKFSCSYTLHGSDDQQLEIRAQDIAGNRAQKQISVSYDQTAPTFEQPPRILQREDSLAGGRPITIEAIVRESTQASMDVNTPFGVFEGSCVREQQIDSDANTNYLVCTTQVLLPNERMTTTAQVVIMDAARNKLTRAISLDIFPADQDVQPDFWQISATAQKPIDPLLWRNIPQYLPITLDFTNIQGSSSVQPIQVDVKDCSWAGFTGGNQNVITPLAKIVPPTASQTGVVLRIAQQTQVYDNPTHPLRENPIECTLRVYTKAGNIVYVQPEEELVQIQPRFYNYPSVGEKLAQEQVSAAQTVQSWQRNLALIDGTIRTVGAACTVAGGIESTAAGLAVLATATAWVPDTSQALDQSSKRLDGYASRLGSALEPLCSYIACDSIADSQYANLITAPYQNDALWDYVAASGGAHSPEELIDPYKSFMVAAATMCMPAMSYHMNTWMGTQCTYQQCLENSAQTGMSVIECGEQRSSDQCEYIAGAAANFIPWVNIWGSITGQLQAAIASPTTLFGVTSLICNTLHGDVGTNYNPKEGVDLPWPASLACTVAEFPKKATTLLRLKDSITQSLRIMDTVDAPGSEVCSELIAQGVDDRVYLPFSWNGYCEGGFTAATDNGKRYTVINGKVCQFTTPQDDAQDSAVLSAQDAFLGGTTNCDPSALEGTNPGVVSRMEDLGDQCAQQVDNQIRDLQTWGAYEFAYQEHITAQNHYHTTQAVLEQSEQRFESNIAAAHEKDEGNRFSILIDAVRYCNSPTDGACDAYMGEERFANVYGDQFSSVEEAKSFYEDAIIPLTQAHSDLLDKKTIAGIAEADKKIAEREKKEAEKRVREEANHLDWISRGGGLRNSVNSFVLWGRVGGTLMDFADLESPDFLQDASDAVGVIRNAPEQAITNLVCNDNQIIEQGSTARTGSGVIAAHILAHAGRDHSLVEQSYSYVIETYLNTNSDQGSAQIVLKNPGIQLVENIGLSNVNRVDDAALTTDSSSHYELACIVFSDDADVREIFTNFPGDDNELCTKIQWGQE